MSNIQLPGLSTGLDTSAIIQQLMQVESRRLTLFQNQVTQRTEIRTAVNTLQSKLSSFQSALSALNDASQLRSFNVTSSNTDKVTAEAASGANEGSHAVQVKQLATANRWVHDGFKYDTSYVGAGAFILSYNHQELIIQTTEETTLKDLVNLINNASDNPGVTAGILKYDDGSGNPFHLVLNGRHSGSDYQVSINSSNSEIHTADAILQTSGNNAALTTKLSDMTDFTGGEFNFPDVSQVTISGSLNDGTLVDTTIEVNRYTTVADLIDEIEEAFGDTVKVTLDEGRLQIFDKTSGLSQMSLQVTFGDGESSSAVLGFSRTSEGGSINANIDAFLPGTFLETQIAQDSLIKVDSYPPDIIDPETGDILEERWISRSSNTIDDVISGVTLNLHGTTVNTEGGYDKLEINMTRNTESLKSKLQTMMDAYNSVVLYFQETTAYDSETNTSGILSREFGLTSLNSILRSPFVANAVGFSGSDSFINPRDIGFSFGSDGLLSLDQEKLDEAIAQDYLGVLTLIGAQKTGSSSGADASSVKFYNSSRYTEAGTYNVRVEIDGDGNITSALIKLADEDWAQARQAEFSGNYVFGASGDPNARNPEMDLQLAIDTSRINSTLEATISIRQGFTGNLHELVSKANDVTTGRVAVSKKSLDSQIRNLNTRIDQEETRLERVRSRLVSQYARLEKLLTTIQQQFSGLNML